MTTPYEKKFRPDEHLTFVHGFEYSPFTRFGSIVPQDCEWNDIEVVLAHDDNTDIPRFTFFYNNIALGTGFVSLDRLVPAHSSDNMQPASEEPKESEKDIMSVIHSFCR